MGIYLSTVDGERTSCSFKSSLMTDTSRLRRQAVVEVNDAEGMHEITDVEIIVVVAMLYFVLVATLPKSKLDNRALSNSRPSGATPLGLAILASIDSSSLL